MFRSTKVHHPSEGVDHLMGSLNIKFVLFFQIKIQKGETKFVAHSPGLRSNIFSIFSMFSINPKFTMTSEIIYYQVNCCFMLHLSQSYSGK